MAGQQLVWDDIGKKTYETGTKKGVLYPQDASGTYPKGVAWNGLIGVTETPSGAEATALYANDAKYLSLLSAEELGGTIEAYTYPVEFEACDGSADMIAGVSIGQQDRTPFGLSYVTTIGNDTKGTAHGYKIHIVYGCMASTSERAYTSINDSPEAITLSWEFTTTPVPVANHKPTASVVIDSTKLTPEKMKKIEDVLYGSASAAARLPLPAEIVELINAVV